MISSVRVQPPTHTHTPTNAHRPGLQLDAAHPKTPAARGGVSSVQTPPLHDRSPSGCGAAPRGGHGSRPARPPPAPRSSCSGNKSPARARVKFNNCSHFWCQFCQHLCMLLSFIANQKKKQDSCMSDKARKEKTHHFLAIVCDQGLMIVIPSHTDVSSPGSSL